MGDPTVGGAALPPLGLRWSRNPSTAGLNVSWGGSPRTGQCHSPSESLSSLPPPHLPFLGLTTDASRGQAGVICGLGAHSLPFGTLALGALP